MASFDRSRHGWDGINNGGEVYGSSSSRRTYNDISEKMSMETDRINAMLDAIDMSDGLDATNDNIQNDNLSDMLSDEYVENKLTMDKTQSQIEYLQNNLGLVFGGSVEQRAEQMVEAMARGEFDTNGKPLTETQENGKTLVKDMESGYAKISILAVLSILVSFTIIVFGVMLSR